VHGKIPDVVVKGPADGIGLPERKENADDHDQPILGPVFRPLVPLVGGISRVQNVGLSPQTLPFPTADHCLPCRLKYSGRWRGCGRLRVCGRDEPSGTSQHQTVLSFHRFGSSKRD
jgi:hypothetical protein